MPLHDIGVEEFLLALGGATPVDEDQAVIPEDGPAEGSGVNDRRRVARAR